MTSERLRVIGDRAFAAPIEVVYQLRGRFALLFRADTRGFAATLRPVLRELVALSVVELTPAPCAFRTAADAPRADFDFAIFGLTLEREAIFCLRCTDVVPLGIVVSL